MMINTTFARRGRHVAAVIAALALTVSLASCTGDAGGGAVGGGGGDSGAAARLDPDATIQVATIQEPDSLDPAEGTGGHGYPYLYNIFDRLLNLNPETAELEPGLATEWEFSEDGLTLTLKLRDGVTFQDGTEFNADAVVASLNHYKELGHQKDLDPVSNVVAEGDDSVVITLREQYSALPSSLADRAGMIVSPTAVEKYGDEFGRNPVGTGPYTYVEWAAGSKVSYKRYDDYWDNDNPAKAAELIVNLFPTSTAMASALTTGQIDFGYVFDPRDISTLESSPGLTVQADPSLQFYDFALNNDMEPTNDPAVRTAMSYAVDRDQINDSVNAGAGTPAYLPLPPTTWSGEIPEGSEAPTYDPEKAKQMLADAGYPDGVSLTVCYDPNANGGQQLFTLAQAQMAEAGITLDPIVSPGNDCNDRFVVQKTINSYMKAWSGRPDPYMTYEQNFSSTGLYNVGKKPNGDMDALLEQAAQATTLDEQKPLFAKLNAEFLEQTPYVATVYVPTVSAYNDKIVEFTQNFMGKTDLTTIGKSR